MHVRENKLKQIWRSGGTVFSSSVRLAEPGLCEILGYAGFDFVLLDGEHGAIDAGAVDRMTQSCFAGGTVPVVRVLRNNDPEAVMHSLDLGAQGILIPHCRSAEEAAWARDQGYRAIGFGGAENYVMNTARQFLEAMGR